MQILQHLSFIKKTNIAFLSECEMDYISPSECLPGIIETNGKENGAKNGIIDPYEDLIKGHLEAEEKKKVRSKLL